MCEFLSPALKVNSQRLQEKQPLVSDQIAQAVRELLEKAEDVGSSIRMVCEFLKAGVQSKA